MFSSKIYPSPYTENKSKKFYCRCYVVKLFLYFSFFIFPHFQFLSCISCHVKNFYYFLGGSHVFDDSFFIFKETYYNTWKSYIQLQVPVMIFNKEALVSISSISNSKNPTWNLLSFVSRIVVNECLKNSVQNCLVLLWFRIIGENIKAFGFHNNTQAFSEPCQTSKMERFAEIVNNF